MSVKISTDNKSRRDKLAAIMALTGEDMYRAMDSVLELLTQISHKDYIPFEFGYYVRSSDKLFLTKRRRKFLSKLLRSGNEDDRVKFLRSLKVDEFIDLLTIYVREEILVEQGNLNIHVLTEHDNTFDDE